MYMIGVCILQICWCIQSTWIVMLRVFITDFVIIIKHSRVALIYIRCSCGISIMNVMYGIMSAVIIHGIVYMYTDIDECQMSPPCEQGCSNTVGSYQCTCGIGYTLNDDGRSCTGITLMQACI